MTQQFSQCFVKLIYGVSHLNIFVGEMGKNMHLKNKMLKNLQFNVDLF